LKYLAAQSRLSIRKLAMIYFPIDVGFCWGWWALVCG